MTAAATHHSLRDCFTAIFDAAGKDPIEHIVAMTYEFEDQQLLNLLAGRPMDENFLPRRFDLKKISELAPVVIYDARKTKEANLVPHFLDLLPVKMPAFSCHHPKAYLVVTQASVQLLLGSMNLTHTGLFRNRELFQEFRWSLSETQDSGLLGDFVEILEQHHGEFESASLGAAITGLRRRVSDWQQGNGEARHHLVASGYGATSGLARLGALWRELSSGARVRQVFAVSPFFDLGTGSDTFAGMLVREFGELEALHIVTDRACIGKLCKGHFAEVPKRVLHAIEETLGEDEQRRIEVANDGANRGLHLQRKLHAKLLVLCGDDGFLVYGGSANFTCKAWNGDNREMGVAWYERGNAARFIAGVEASLHAVRDNQYSLLLDAPTVFEVQDEDDYEGKPGYPDFVQCIVLEEVADSANFRFSVSSAELDRLADYDILWGLERLQFNAGVSAPLAASTLFARLLGGRNLCFVLKANAEARFYLPFRHTPALFEKRDLHLHESAEDWMLYQLGIGQSGPVDPDECVPGEGDKAVWAAQAFDSNREDNATIKVQRYLSLFARVEAEFHRRAEAVGAFPLDQRRSTWKGTVATPIETLAAVITRKQSGPVNHLHRIFQLGELALLARALPSEGDAGRELHAAILAKMPSDAGDPVLGHYIGFCGGSNVG